VGNSSKLVDGIIIRGFSNDKRRKTYLVKKIRIFSHIT